jgi:enoyl-CoA hydratase
MASNVRYDRRGDVAVITLDRPDHRNAIDFDTGEQLLDALHRLDDDADAAVGVVTGAGDTFCAGGDLKEISDHGTLENREDGFMGFSHAEPETPLIAAVEGHAVGGGIELALLCDLRVAAESAVFGCFERRWGVPLIDGGTQRLPEIVGLGRAMDMILTGRGVDADEALDWGLASRVVPDGEALDAAVEMGNAIARFPQKTVQTDKKAVYQGLGEGMDRGLAIESWWGTHAMETAREGATRFAEGEGRGGAGTYEELVDRSDI